jgi:hypothetical protein
MKSLFNDTMSLKKIYPWMMSRSDAVQCHRIDNGQHIELPMPPPPYPSEPTTTRMTVLGSLRELHKAYCGNIHPTTLAFKRRGAARRGNRGHRGGRGSGFGAGPSA